MADLKISYEKGWNSACIHADLPWSYEEDYQMRMLKNNSIPHLAHMIRNRKRRNEQIYLPVRRRNITGRKIPVQRYSCKGCSYIYRTAP